MTTTASSSAAGSDDDVSEEGRFCAATGRAVAVATIVIPVRTEEATSRLLKNLLANGFPLATLRPNRGPSLLTTRRLLPSLICREFFSRPGWSELSDASNNAFQAGGDCSKRCRRPDIGARRRSRTLVQYLATDRIDLSKLACRVLDEDFDGLALFDQRGSADQG